MQREQDVFSKRSHFARSRSRSLGVLFPLLTLRARISRSLVPVLPVPMHREDREEGSDYALAFPRGLVPPPCSSRSLSLIFHGYPPTKCQGTLRPFFVTSIPTGGNHLHVEPIAGLFDDLKGHALRLEVLDDVR